METCGLMPSFCSAGTEFVRGIPPSDSNQSRCYGSSLFHKVPGGAGHPGGPLYMISANSGSQFYVGTYNDTEERMTVVGKRQWLDYSTNYKWAAVGTQGLNPATDSGRLITVAWVPAGGTGRVPCLPSGCPSVISLVRSITWDTATSQLVSFPVAEYATLRNQTFLDGAVVGPIAAGAAKALEVRQWRALHMLITNVSS